MSRIKFTTTQAIIHAHGMSDVGAGNLGTYHFEWLDNLRGLEATWSSTKGVRVTGGTLTSVALAFSSVPGRPLCLVDGESQAPCGADLWTQVYEGPLDIAWTQTFKSTLKVSTEKGAWRITGRVVIVYAVHGVTTPSGQVIPDQTIKDQTALPCYKAGDSPQLLCVTVTPKNGSVTSGTPVIHLGPTFTLSARSLWPIADGTYEPGFDYTLEPGILEMNTL